MPSVLFTASTFSHIISFHLPYLRRFRELGWQVDVACGGAMRDIPFADVTAVKNGAVYQMPVGFEAWDSPVPSGILGTLWMLHTLHPELYTAEQFAADADEFYSTFYGFHVALDQAA